MAKARKVEKKKPAGKKPAVRRPAKPSAPSASSARGASRGVKQAVNQGVKKPSPKATAPKASKGKPVKTAPPKKAAAPLPAPIPIVVPPATKAPAKFRREYRKWRDVLIGLRHRLLREGSHLEEEGLKALEQEVSVDHMADYGSDSFEQETTLQLIESNSVSLRDVDNALKRIEQGTYGLCEDCEALIPPARIAVLPHARYCIACQSKREGVTE